MIKDFKKFALKGNVMDLAVGVIIGASFGKIITSLVNDILMPILGFIIGGVNFSGLKYVIVPASDEVAESAILYGAFIQSIFDFLIIAISIFFFVRFLTSMKKQEPIVEEKPPEASPQEVLLTEIRDLLKEK